MENGGGFGVAGESGAHALAQCWESLGKESCRVCLEKAVRELKRCVSRREGRAMNSGCYLRYSDYKFYNDHNGHGKIRGKIYLLILVVFFSFNKHTFINKKSVEISITMNCVYLFNY